MKEIKKIINMQIALLTVLIIIFLVRIPSFSEPFNRDEGGYGYVAGRLGAGDKLYSDIFDFKPPAIYYTYLFVQKIFGNSEADLRLFTTIYSIFSTLAIFALASFLYGSKSGLISAFLFGVFSGGLVLEGNNANTEVFMILPLILSTYAFLVWLKKEQPVLLFISGALTGIGFLFKVVAIYNLLFFLAFLLIMLFARNNGLTIRRTLFCCLAILAGFIVMQIPVLLYFYLKGNIADFIFGVFVFGFTYVNVAYGSAYLFRFISRTITVFREGFLIWIASASSAIYVLLHERKRENLFILLWFIFSLFGVLSGGMFYQHYYIQLLPALSILGGYCINKIFGLNVYKQKVPDISNYFVMLMLLGSVFLFFIVNYPYYQNYFSFFNKNITKEEYQSFFKYRNFPLNQRMASYLKDNSGFNDYIFIWGSEPVIYFLSERKSPTKYLVDFFVRNIHGALAETVQKINQKKPVFIVIMSKPFSKLEEVLVQDYYLDSKIEGIPVYKRK